MSFFYYFLLLKALDFCFVVFQFFNKTVNIAFDLIFEHSLKHV